MNGFLFVLWLAISCQNPSPVHAAGANSDIALKKHCPPGFELTENNQCRFRSQYEAYSSIGSKGVGGLQTGLPSIRDGFSPQQIDLGRYLFFDPILSRNNSLSCASCHNPNKGFSDGKRLAEGMSDQELQRNSPTLWNSGFLKSFNWDAAHQSFEDQMSGPLYNPQEMNQTPEILVEKLQTISSYRQLFRSAFPESLPGISEANIKQALAAFQSSLVSLNSRYDRYVHGYHAALNKQEIEGLNVFRSFVARCAECHTPPLFTNQQVAVIGVSDPVEDEGAAITLDLPKLTGGFKVPTLRNIAKSAPYMHHGSKKDLSSVLQFYNKGRGNELAGRKLHLHWHITSPRLQEKELVALEAFLNALTDESFKPQTPAQLPSGLILTSESLEPQP